MDEPVGVEMPYLNFKLKYSKCAVEKLNVTQIILKLSHTYSSRWLKNNSHLYNSLIC